MVKMTHFVSDNEVGDSFQDFFSLASNVTSSPETNTSESGILISAKEHLAWLRLKEEEKNACLALSVEDETSPAYDTFCPRVWDRILCWPPAIPGSVASLPCTIVSGFNSPGNATRVCSIDGIWAGNSTPEEGWTDYSVCMEHHDPEKPSLSLQEWLPHIRNLSLIGYSISLITLAVSFGILASLRKLRCPRNILHLHLFASFMLRALVVLIKKLLEDTVLPEHLHHFSNDEVDLSPGSWSCQLSITIWQYFILANYSWILVEGLYLHNLIFLALFTDSSAITLYISLGWGLPLVCVSLWATLRFFLDNVHCWTVNNISWIFWVCIRTPVAVSNLVNFVFFINITRVLFMKLQSSISPESMRYRKLGKSTLVLVPLFGVHYFMLWGLSVSTNDRVELVWLFLDQVFSSFQGFFVAVLYCLMNGEVRQEMRKLFHRCRGDTYQDATYSTVISHTKTYFSRGRTSIHSMNSATDRRADRQSPSPQLFRPKDCFSPSPIALTPTSTRVPPEFCSLNSSHSKLQDTMKHSESGKEMIELQDNLISTTVCINSNTPVHPKMIPDSSMSEEETPLITNDDAIQLSIREPKPHDGAQQGTAVEGMKKVTSNGMVLNAKEILVKVSDEAISGGIEINPQCSLLENEAPNGENML